MMRKRYLQLLPTGEQESPAQMLHRIAHALAEVDYNYGASTIQVEETERKFLEVLASHEYTPAGRTITNAGAPTPVVANCIVLPIQDSMTSIFKTLKDAALLQKAGSGLGFAFSHLRPAGSYVFKSQGMASGPVSFLHVYNEAFGVIKQQGRHGANMAILNVEHPDILDFIHCKKVEGSIRNFNISVGVTDRFMRAVTEHPNEAWEPAFDGKHMPLRRITRDRSGVILNIEEITMTAQQLFDEIVHGAWHNGEPGVVFLDSVNKTNPMIAMQEIDACNPCGEQFLPWYDVCNLSSINLAKLVQNGRVDHERLRYVTRVAAHMSDNVIDIYEYPVQEVQDMSRNNRRIGLGIMGFADMLYQMNTRYDSEAGYAVAESVMSTIQDEAHKVSREFAITRGVFPNWDKSTYAKTGIKMRNTMLTTVAPTGSISMFLNTSSGVEPNFALSFTKQDKDGWKYYYTNQYFEKALKDRGLYSDKLMDQIVAEGSVKNIALPQDLKDTFVVSMDIAAEAHIKMQAAFQRHVDNAISKTINFPFEATEEDVRQGYIMAWKLGCKGCTVYRDGSRQVQVLNLNKNVKDKSEVPLTAQLDGDGSLAETAATIEQTVEAATLPNPVVAQSAPTPAITDASGYGIITPRERPQILEGKTYQVKTAYGNLYITVNDTPGDGPFEVFSQLGKAGGFFHSQVEAICRLISLNLRAGVKVEEVINQLKGIRGPDPMWNQGKPMLSIADAIAQTLERHLEGKSKQTKLEFPTKTEAIEATQSPTMQKVEIEEVILTPGPGADLHPTKPATSIANIGTAPACPDCGNMLNMAEGCMTCNNCGFSKCG
ncbi:MAG: ribonucleoside-diphosphate reductase, adenosylcobalamin-dependent [Candidatus Doudnabacteria bacterium RIFCSPHIGHO2_01_FULL_50_11]|uniref:Vitamin B12-dependent ribonucleotide reductase n=1 Tax=Candidatus Doudnabacteria bacterium RIFCSPHIGHO2_01_FULL_50_11 TaxID=1817828 RepID=A0A1F5PJ14_9BACT|nr:MAG: ribonucleoside-diphosphate reductase, adenosylcobalamin-dependent [Candidatus Doudnabacteria bacterium RIFCSPHIGHO2_01_FULL_50_11]